MEETELAFDTAHPFYTYTFSVAAETNVGTGPFAAEVTLTAPEDGKASTCSCIFLCKILHTQYLQELLGH